MKRVLVHGYFRDNLGDDLFFRVLALRYPNVKFYIPTTRCTYDRKFADLSNVKVVDFMKIARLTNRKVYMLPKIYSRLNMKRFDAVVCIGGSLFIDRKNPTPVDRIEAEKYSFICDWEYAKQAGVPYYVLGANWGPCYNDYFYNYFSRAFDSLTDLCFREQKSFQEFSHKKAARCTGDILMDNSVIKKEAISSIKKKQIVISVVNPTTKNEVVCNADIYFDKIARLCQKYVEKNYEVKLISFCKDEGDEGAINKVVALLKNKTKVEAVFYQDNWKEILNLIGESELVIASRFHAAVIGWTLGVPVYSLVYSNKTLYLIQDCGFEHGYTRIEDIGELDIDAVMENAILPVDIQKFSGAESAFGRLDELLK